MAKLRFILGTQRIPLSTAGCGPENKSHFFSIWLLPKVLHGGRGIRGENGFFCHLFCQLHRPQGWGGDQNCSQLASSQKESGVGRGG